MCEKFCKRTNTFIVNSERNIKAVRREESERLHKIVENRNGAYGLECVLTVSDAFMGANYITIWKKWVSSDIEKGIEHNNIRLLFYSEIKKKWKKDKKKWVFCASLRNDCVAKKLFAIHYRCWLVYSIYVSRTTANSEWEFDINIVRKNSMASVPLIETLPTRIFSSSPRIYVRTTASEASRGRLARKRIILI